MSQDPARRALAAHLIWSRTKFLGGSLRSIRNPLSGRVECVLFDVLEGAGVAAEFWHEWGRRLRDGGFPVRSESIADRFELLTSHAAIRHLFDSYAAPSARRRTAFAQLRRAERVARNGI